MSICVFSIIIETVNVFAMTVCEQQQLVKSIRIFFSLTRILHRIPKENSSSPSRPDDEEAVACTGCFKSIRRAGRDVERLNEGRQDGAGIITWKGGAFQN